MSNVYELGQGFDILWELIEAGETEDDVIEEAFENLTEDLAAKFENCCKYITNEKTSIDGLKAEKKRLEAKIASRENAIKRLKAAMQKALDKSGNKKLPCGSFLVYTQKNPKSLVMDETSIEYIPQGYLKTRNPEIDTAKIKDVLENGTDEEKEKLEGIAHLVQTESLRIK